MDGVIWSLFPNILRFSFFDRHILIDLMPSNNTPVFSFASKSILPMLI